MERETYDFGWNSATAPSKMAYTTQAIVKYGASSAEAALNEKLEEQHIEEGHDR